MKKLILLYNFSGERLSGVKRSAALLRAAVKEIPKESYGQKLGYLAEVKGYERQEPDSQESFDEEMLIMSGFTGDDIEMLIKSLHRHGVGRIALKAIITQTNIEWTSTQLYRAVREDHEEMMRRRQS